MKKIITIAVAVLIAAAALYIVLKRYDHEWKGVDKSVVERFAREAGRPAKEPLINTDRGDLLLFFFLIAGTVGGFVGGYYFRELFPSKEGGSQRAGTMNREASP